MKSVESIQELKLVDEYEEQCVPSGGFAFQADPVQRRNGRAPTKVKLFRLSYWLIKVITFAGSEKSSQ